ncbi:hypothetical protein GCM10010123_00660 [Pilimelia anulata]|uniref:Uncharacterized protein n=1 Tax=Pilimelia anulata TaxID=53371 RepID=A0A8J3F5Q6_9ACTN|nr:hypothetical protein [Pilimelia anulata]GGJ74524.1 hypothetical protein GCM10010123_00660 [Pilimelia anulata]
MSVAPGQPDPPAPPPGPGVTPPFPAPPTEGRSTRLWVGLLSGGLVALLCCGGGLSACVGLAVVGTKAVNEHAAAAVRDYLDDVRAGRYREAYDELCPEARERESLADYTARVRGEPGLRAYVLRDAELGPASVRVPVDVTYADGTGGTWRVGMEQDRRTGKLEVCAIDR